MPSVRSLNASRAVLATGAGVVAGAGGVCNSLRVALASWSYPGCPGFIFCLPTVIGCPGAVLATVLAGVDVVPSGVVTVAPGVVGPMAFVLVGRGVFGFGTPVGCLYVTVAPAPV